MKRRDDRFGAGHARDCAPGRAHGRVFGAVLALLVASAGPRPGLAQEIAGRPRVIDAGTLDFSGRRVRLHGIDAPDLTQTCRLAGQVAGQSWTCGRDARWAAINRIHPHWVSCDARGRDPQGTELAVCYLAGFGQHELNVWLVAQGWALAAPGAPKAYAAAQATARAAGRGLWRGDFVPPGAWRRGQRLP
jgi:endonuclease YncB( thermonuclease family)